MKAPVRWNHPGFSSLPVGGKARALGELTRAGFAVPEWWVILPDGDPAADPTGRGPWAVRSSAIDEDGRDHSFAGQLESFLDVPSGDLAAKVCLVRESGEAERIAFYRRQAGLSLPPPVPAVIIQEMVNAEAAGVAFSADPVTGRRGVAVVAAVRGLGDKLVSGEASSDTFHVARSGEVSDRKLAGAESAISDAQATAVARLARDAARLFGEPQDIEWAMAGGRLFILQSRPITSFARMVDPDGAWQMWDNSNIAESFNGVTTPLTFSFAREVYTEVYRQFARILRVPARRIAANRDVFGRMLGLVRGRVYYNLLSWYRVLALLPGFAVNRRFMEQMMGVKESLPPEALIGIIEPPRRAGLFDWLEIGGTLAGLVWNHIRLDGRIGEFYRRLNESLRPPIPPLEDMRPDELAASYRHLQSDLLTRWDAPLINDFFAMIYFGVSRKLVTTWCGDPDGTLQNDMLACQGGIISAEPARRILEMAGIARRTPGLPSLLAEGSLCEIESGSPREFWEVFRDYLDKFGDRCLEELKLESPTLHDDPLGFLRAVGRMAARPETHRPGLPVAAAAEVKVERALSGHPLRRMIFAFVIGRTRELVRQRENLRFERTRVFGRVRRIFVELGRRLHALGALDEARDVFHLEAEEVLGFVEGTISTTRIAALAHLRREEFDGWHSDPPAARFETRGAVHGGNDFRGRDAAEAPVTGDRIKGIGCCPGTVRGRARVILNPRSAVIEPGEILVAPRTDPGWIMLFPSAAGLLVEHGSLLSHSAIVAREMGIPAVVSLPGLTEWLTTGETVELDGRTGWVTRLDASGKEA